MITQLDIETRLWFYGILIIEGQVMLFDIFDFIPISAN